MFFEGRISYIRGACNYPTINANFESQFSDIRLKSVSFLVYIYPKRNDGGDTTKNKNKTTSICRNVRKTKVVSTISWYKVGKHWHSCRTMSILRNEFKIFQHERLLNKNFIFSLFTISFKDRSLNVEIHLLS